jgi:Uma2 family endonuclease
MTVPLQRRRFSTGDYARMREIGILKEDDRVELLAGEMHDLRPQPDEVILVIEVADSSIDYDRTEKLPRYAAANIPEVWIVDIGAQTVEQHTQPRARRYRTVPVLEPGETLIAAALTSVALSVEQIVGPEPLP